MATSNPMPQPYSIPPSAVYDCCNKTLLSVFILPTPQEPPYILDCALTTYFVIFVATWHERDSEDVHYELNKYMNVTLHAWLTVVMLVSFVLREQGSTCLHILDDTKHVHDYE